MKLTGKCKDDFFIFFQSERRGTEMGFYELPELFQNALVIEFFDFVGIYINISAIPFSKDFRVEIRAIDNSFLSSCDYEAFNSRTEATNAALEKANELYNKNKL